MRTTLKSLFGHLAVIAWGMAVVVAWSKPALADDLFVSAATANSVARFDGQTGAYLGNFVAPGAGGLSDPQGIAFGPDGNLYVASNGSNNVLRFNGQTGAFIDVFVTPGMGWPAEINFRGNHLYVSDFEGNRVARYDAFSGAFVDDFATGLPFGADGQSWDTNGDLYVSSWGDNSIKKYNGTTGALIGNFVAPGGGSLNGPLDNLFLPSGQFLVSSYNNSRVKRYSSTGVFLGELALASPQGLQIGPDGFLYAGSFTLGRINRYHPTTFALQGTFAVAPASFTNNFVFGPSVPEPAGLLSCAPAIALAMRRTVRPRAAGTRRG